MIKQPYMDGREEHFPNNSTHTYVVSLLYIDCINVFYGAQ